MGLSKKKHFEHAARVHNQCFFGQPHGAWLPTVGCMNQKRNKNLRRFPGLVTLVLLSCDRRKPRKALPPCFSSQYLSLKTTKFEICTHLWREHFPQTHCEKPNLCLRRFIFGHFPFRGGPATGRTFGIRGL